MKLRALVLVCSCLMLFACGDDDAGSNADGGSAGSGGGASGKGGGSDDGIPDGIWGCSNSEGGCSCAMRVDAAEAPPNFPDATCSTAQPCCYVRNVIDDPDYWQCFCNQVSEADCDLTVESINTAADSPFQKAQRVDHCAPGVEGGSDDCKVGRFAVTLDATAHEGCVDRFDAGDLNHVIAKLEDGHTVIVNFNGQVPADDACKLVSLRKPGSENNDWNADADNCVVAITTYGKSGERVVGTFSATLAPEASVTGTRELVEGSFDVAVP